MDKILILDFGSQYTQLIARRVREMHVYSELHSHDMSEEDIKAFNPKGIILSGGPNSVYESDTPIAPPIVFDLGVPVLGICYGMQTMAAQLGGKVENANTREFGYAEIRAHNHSPLLENIQDKTNPEGHGLLDVWMSHGDKVTELPPQFKVIASNASTPIAGMMHESKNSSVAAALIHKAIGKKLTCVFVDNGLLRLNEATQVMKTFHDNLGVKVIHVDASNKFLNDLKGVTDPEQKRKIIGREFVEVFQNEAKKIPKAKWLAQGTIYPDVIESASAKTKKAHTIKSHHNVGGLPKTLNLKLLEPLRELFKDEVRELGIALGLPKTMVYRHPFPGPGLGVRILGEVKSEFADLLRRADAIFIEELIHSGWYEKTSQAFAVFLPVKSVGVMGDGRTYEYVVALRAVVTSDFMTAHWAELPYDLLGKVSNRIINEVRGINRVVYDISGKPPATIEWE